MINFMFLFLLFLIYSFIGYICEMITIAIKNKRIVNRGFLCGPVLPVYGLGSIFIIYCLLRYKTDPIVVFVFGVIICSALEYFTSFLLEKIFNNMWWDYFDYRYNLNGRICLFNSILFGLGSLVIIYIGHPIIMFILALINIEILKIISIILTLLFICDVVYSVIVAFNLRNRLIIVEELKNEKLAKIPLMFEKSLKERVAKFKLYPSRLLKAFPTINIKYKNDFNIMKKVKKKNKKRAKKNS